MTKNKLLTYAIIGVLCLFSALSCYAETYHLDVKYPSYLFENQYVNSVSCSIESRELNRYFDTKQMIIDMSLKNLRIDSGLSDFSFKLSRDNTLTFTLPESKIDTTDATYIEGIIESEELLNIINKSILSFNKIIKTKAKLLCHEIKSVWVFLGKSFEEKNELKSIFSVPYENRHAKVIFHNFESAKLPINYSEWSLNQNNDQIGNLELNIEYQQLGSVHVPHHFVIQYPNVSRDPTEKGRMFDMKFNNCKIE